MSSNDGGFWWKTPNPSPALYTVLLACLVAFLCYLATSLGWALVIRPQMLWPIWPGCAFLVAVLLLAPRSIWPILLTAGLVGFVVYDLQVGFALRSTALLILADIVEILIVAIGVSYCFDGVPRLNSVKSVAKYSFFAVMLAPLAAASISSIVFGADYWTHWRIGFFTEALALLTLTPAILSWVNLIRKWKSLAFYFEGSTLIIGLTSLGYFAFVKSVHGSLPVIFYALLPFLLWSSLRFGVMGTSTSMIVVAFLSIWGAVHGRGPFAGAESLNNVMSLQLFLFFAAAPFMVLAALVEEQKHTEKALRESEKRFRLVADTAPVLIWMSDIDRLCTYFNKQWLEFTGRSIDLEIGNGWVEGVHAEDSGRCVETYTQAFDRREEFRMEYRLRRHDGEYRWVLDIGVPRFDPDRNFIGYIGTGIDVTERKHAEKALEKSEEKFAKAFRQSPMIVTLTSTKDHRYIDVNETFERVTGWRRDEVIGRTPSDLGLWVHSSERLHLAARLVSEGRLPEVEFHFRTKDGSIRIGSATAELIELNDEPCMLGVSWDITERKRADEALRKSEERFRLAAQAGKMYAYEWDVATDTVMRSEEFVKILGSSEQAKRLTRQQLLTRVHPDDREKFIGTVDHLTPENPSTTISYRMLHPDGALTWVEKSARAFFDEQGRMCRTIGMVADITERKRAEEALRESEARLRLAAQAGKMYAYEWDAVTDEVVRSEEYATILGFTDESRSETHQQFSSRVHPEDLAKFNAAVANLTPENPNTKISYRVLRPDGDVIWVEKSGRAFFDPQGRMLRMVGIVADITERKSAEEALRESEDNLRLLLDSTAEAIHGIDREGRCTFCNAACLSALGYEHANELLGREMHGLIHHTRADGTLYPVEECRVLRAFQTGEGVHVDTEVLWRANGTSFPAEYWSYPQRRGQEIVGAVVAFIDITQRKLAEAALANVSRRLIEAQEQERTRIARELHDDMGQRLALLANELEQLRHDPPTLPEVRSRIGELQKKATKVALDVQTLSHELHSAKLEYLGIAVAMRGFCQEFGEQTRAKIDFKSQDLPSPLSPQISLCLFRVLQEALHNSVKHSRVRRVEVRLWGTSNEIHLAVSDAGAGFDSEMAKQSRGLGLISMEERLKLLNGTLSIETQLKRGTTIHARVPISSEMDLRHAAG